MAQSIDTFGSIHEFGVDSKGNFHIDEEGDPMIGFYYQLTNHKDEAISHMVGPYGTGEAAEKACNRAWLTGDF